MITRLRALSLGVVLLAFVSPAGAAESILHDCEITEKVSDLNWVSRKSAVVFDADGNAQVIDTLVMAADIGPAPARVNRRARDDLRLRRTVSGVVDVRNRPIGPFKLTDFLDDEAKTLRVFAKIAGVPEKVSGSCITRRR